MIDKCKRCGDEFDAEDFKGKTEHTKEHYGESASLLYYQSIFERVNPTQTRLGE